MPNNKVLASAAALRLTSRTTTTGSSSNASLRRTMFQTTTRMSSNRRSMATAATASSSSSIHSSSSQQLQQLHHHTTASPARPQTARSHYSDPTTTATTAKATATPPTPPTNHQRYANGSNRFSSLAYWPEEDDPDDFSSLENHHRHDRNNNYNISGNNSVPISGQNDSQPQPQQEQSDNNSEQLERQPQQLQHDQEDVFTPGSCSTRLHDPYEPLPKPLPEPNFTFLRRVLNPVWTTTTLQDNPRNANLPKESEAESQSQQSSSSSQPQHRRRPLVVALDSPQGRKRLLRSMAGNAAVPYLALQNHFTNQSDPAYCGVTTLLVVLNAFAVDPLKRWKGGWRYFGHEDVLLDQCCLDPERVRRIGISMTQFAQFAACQGLHVTLKRPELEDVEQEPQPQAQQRQSKKYSLQDFRADILNVLTEPPPSEESLLDDDNNDTDDDTAPQNLSSLLVASYSRPHIGQTGEGHFSPLAAYDAASDSVLVLDVARFKYPPYWLDVAQLYQAMMPLDSRTQQSRGWFVLEPPPSDNYYNGSVITDEGKIPAAQVPKVGDDPSCPAQAVKVEYCPNNNNNKK